VSITIPATTQIQRPKAMFFFYSPLQTVFSSPTVSDTTQVSITSAPRTTLKTYTLTIPAGADRIRILVRGFVGGYNIFGGRVYVNINGTDVASILIITNTAEALLIDYIGSISPGSYTIRIDGEAETGYTLYITKVFIATGIGLTSTTLTTIRSFTVTYQLLRQGDIRYSPGVRVFVFGNRRTTAPLTLTIPEATSVTVGRNNLGAGNDNDKAETILAILTGSVVLQEGGEFTIDVSIRGGVGASGDVVIITRILARAQLRRETDSVGEVRVYERGLAEYFARALLVSVPGGGASLAHYILRRDIQDRPLAWTPISSFGTDITSYNFKIAVVASIHFSSGFGEDSRGEGYTEWVQVVVWG
jgi:hypothetical protein